MVSNNKQIFLDKNVCYSRTNCNTIRQLIRLYRPSEVIFCISNFRNHGTLILCYCTCLFVLSLTMLNSWVSLMSTTLPKEWTKTGQQTSLIFNHHSNFNPMYSVSLWIKMSKIIKCFGSKCSTEGPWTTRMMSHGEKTHIISRWKIALCYAGVLCEFFVEIPKSH